LNRAKWYGRSILVFEMFIVTVLLFSGCASRKTWVQFTKYKPRFTKEWNQYKGKSVYLMNFDNQAPNTSIWYYYSTDQKLYYGTSSTIHNYFWYAFHDAFVKAGIAVSSVDHPDLTVPAMWVTLRSITDKSYNIRVTVQRKGATGFMKEYSTEEALPAEMDRNTPRDGEEGL
jgi:hypothetical protein